MKISEITNKAENLNEQGIDARQEYAQANQMVSVYSNQLVHANQMLDAASRVDEEGRPVGDVASAQGAVLAAQTMLNAARSRAHEAERKLVEIEQRKRQAISEIDSYTEREEKNLATLKVLQSKRFGGTVNSFVDDLISRLNKGQQAKRLLENGLGGEGNVKSYSSENINPSYSEFADIEFSEEKRLSNEAFGNTGFSVSKQEADKLLMKGINPSASLPGHEPLHDDQSIEKQFSYNANNVVSDRSIEGNASKDLIKKQGADYSTRLTIDERGSLHQYTSSAYSNINATLRGIDTSFDEGNYENAKNIHSVLAQTQLPCDCTVYRGVSSKALGALRILPDSLLCGKVFSDKGFLSTSLNPKSAFDGDLILEIHAPAGSNGMYVGYVSAAKHYEEEVLFDINQTMRIDHVRRDEFGRRVIKATIL